MFLPCPAAHAAPGAGVHQGKVPTGSGCRAAIARDTSRVYGAQDKDPGGEQEEFAHFGNGPHHPLIPLFLEERFTIS